jgi:hypothetical protein
VVLQDQSNWDECEENCLLVYRASLNRTLEDLPFFLIYFVDSEFDITIWIFYIFDAQKTKKSKKF